MLDLTEYKIMSPGAVPETLTEKFCFGVEFSICVQVIKSRKGEGLDSVCLHFVTKTAYHRGAASKLPFCESRSRC